MNYIIYDSDISGHHPEYISHIVTYLININTNDNYYFIVPNEFHLTYPEIIEISKNVNFINWIYILDEHITKIHKYSMLRRSFAEFILVRKYAISTSANHVLLMYINIFQISLILFHPSFKISGILFMQFLRMDKSSWNSKIKFLRKYITTILLRFNKNISSIFILNDTRTALTLNQKLKTDIFHMLPDPIPQWNSINKRNIREKYQIKENKMIFLHCGLLSDRKGTLEILESIDFLTPSQHKKICILIAGKANNSAYEEVLKAKIENIIKYTDINIIWDNGHILNERLKSLYKECDYVLLPYKNPEASSGNLGHTINADKPVIITGKGLLKEIASKYCQHVFLSEINGSEIAKAIGKCIENKWSYPTASRELFISNHHPNKFSTILLKSFTNADN